MAEEDKEQKEGLKKEKEEKWRNKYNPKNIQNLTYKEII